MAFGLKTLGNMYQGMRRSAAASLADQEATTYAQIAVDGYPADLVSTFSQNEILTDTTARRGQLGTKGLEALEVITNDLGEKELVSEREGLDDFDQYLPKFLDDVFNDLKANGKRAQVLNNPDALKAAADIAKLGNPFYSGKAKLVVEEALKVQVKKNALVKESFSSQANVSLLLTADDELERFAAVTTLLNESISKLKFSDEALNDTIPTQIERAAKGFQEPVRSLVEDELQNVVNSLMANPRSVVDSEDAPVALKSAVLKFVQSAVESAYPGKVKSDSFAQKVINLLGAEPGSETLDKAQSEIKDEILKDVYELVDLDIAFKRQTKELGNITDSVANGTQIHINGEFRQATNLELDAARQALTTTKEKQEKVLKNSLEGTVKLKKAFEKLGLSTEDGEESKGIQDLFWSRLLDTDGDIEKSWIHKIIDPESIKDIASISYDETKDINPDNYEGVAKKLAMLIKDSNSEAEARLANENNLLSQLITAKETLNNRIESSIGLNLTDAAFNPFFASEIEGIAKELATGEGNEAARSLETTLSKFEPNSKLSEITTEIDLSSLTDDQKDLLADAESLFNASAAELSDLLTDLSPANREAVRDFVESTKKHVEAVNVHYLDMIATTMEKARGRAEDVKGHLDSLGLLGDVATGTTAKDLALLSKEVSSIDSKIEKSQQAIHELENHSMTEEEFVSLRDEAMQSLQKRTQAVSISLIEQLEPQKEHLEQIQTELETEAKSYFLAMEDGNDSSFIKMIADLFQNLLDKIGIKLDSSN